MHRIFVVFGILAFLVYCWASVAYQNLVEVPEYAPVEVDLLGGASRAEWDADPRGRFQRLMELEGRHYQLPADAAGDGDPGRALTSGDFSRFIAGVPAGRPVVMKLRDASAFDALLSRKYLLRDAIFDPNDPEGPPLYMGGRPVDKAMLDDLGLRGFRTIAITGHGSPVGFQAGTAVMIAVIFLTLAAALKPALWEPFMVMLEKRRGELEMGTEAGRRNQLEETRLEEERRRLDAELFRERQERRLRGEGEIARRAGEIVKAARAEEKKMKAAGLEAIARSAATAREALDAEIPGLAEMIAGAVAPGNADSRRASAAEETGRHHG